MHDQHIHVIYSRKHTIIDLEVLQNNMDIQMGWQCVFCESWTHLESDTCQNKECKRGGRRAPDPKYDKSGHKEKNLKRAVVVGNYTIEADQGRNYGKTVHFPSCTIKKKSTLGKHSVCEVEMDGFKHKIEVFPSEWIKPHVCLVLTLFLQQYINNLMP